MAAKSSSFVDVDECSSSNEIGKLIQVGNDVGFQITVENVGILDENDPKVVEGAEDTSSIQ